MSKIDSFTVYDDIPNAILGAFVIDNLHARSRFIGHLGAFDPNNYRHFGINVYQRGTMTYYECLVFPEDDAIACGFPGVFRLDEWFKPQWVKPVPQGPKHHRQEQGRVAPSPQVVKELNQTT